MMGDATVLSEYDLDIIHNTRNEVYRGIHKSISENTCIVKYNNSDREIEILNHLKGKISGIPEIIYYNKDDNKSPTGKVFKTMLMKTEVKGRVLDGKIRSNPNHLTRDDFSNEDAKLITIRLIHIVDKLHKCGVIYGDDFLTNLVISDNLEPCIFDFDASFFPQNIDGSRAAISAGYPAESHDIFSLLSFIGYMLGILFPRGDSWKSMSALDLLNFIESSYQMISK